MSTQKQYENDHDYDVSCLNPRDINKIESLLNRNQENKEMEMVINYNMGGCLPKRLLNFSWIVTLNLTKCYLTTLEFLPPKLVNLILDDNFLKNIGDNKGQTIVPDSVEILSVKNNIIDTVHKLPDNLRAFDLSENALKTLHCRIPNSVEIAILSKNKLSCVPIFGNKIKNLDISSNEIQYINQLPQSLTTLDCSDNILEHTNASFPVKLISLNISKNIMRNIDNILLLPNIESIDASNNNITHISSLPNTLTEIDLSENNLQEFPFNDIPVNITYINVKKNPKLNIPDEIKHNVHITFEYSDDRHPKYDNIYGSNYYGNFDNSHNYGQYGQYGQYNQYNQYEQYGQYRYKENYVDYDNNRKKGKYDKSNANYIIMTKRIEI